MRDAPLIRIVTVLLVGAVCAVGCSRDKRDVRPLRAHDAAVQGSAAVVGLPVDAGRPPDLIPVGEASSWNRNSELVRRRFRRCSLQVRACYDAELIRQSRARGTHQRALHGGARGTRHDRCGRRVHAPQSDARDLPGRRCEAVPLCQSPRSPPSRPVLHVRVRTLEVERWHVSRSLPRDVWRSSPVFRSAHDIFVAMHRTPAQPATGKRPQFDLRDCRHGSCLRTRSRRTDMPCSPSLVLIVFIIASASLSVSACSGHTSPCCCHTGRSVVLPPSAVAPIASVSTDGSCGASDGGGEPGARHVERESPQRGDLRRPGGARGRRYVRIHRRIRRDEQECGLRHADRARRRLCPRARRRRALPRLGRALRQERTARRAPAARPAPTVASSARPARA